VSHECREGSRGWSRRSPPRADRLRLVGAGLCGYSNHSSTRYRKFLECFKRLAYHRDDMAEHPDPLLQELIRLLGALGLRMRAHLDAVAQEFGLSLIEARALIVLGAPRSMSELADGLVCDASYSTLIADHLEEEGLVRRQVDLHDRRIKRLVITPKGRKLRERMQVRAEQGLPAIAGLTMAQRRTLHDLLARVAETATDHLLEGGICRESGR